MPLDDDEFRRLFLRVLERSGRSRRALSAVVGRDPGYVAGLLDPTRPSQAQPTPGDLPAASDATDIPGRRPSGGVVGPCPAVVPGLRCGAASGGRAGFDGHGPWFVATGAPGRVS
jgi:hypothetical protein